MWYLHELDPVAWLLVKHRCSSLVCFQCFDSLPEPRSDLYEMDNAPPARDQVNSLSLLQRVQQPIELLLHSYRCRDRGCRFHGCQTMKRVVAHAKGCQRKTNCPVCKNLICMCCYHAKHCNKDNNSCTFHFCQPLKRKVRLHLLRRRLRQVRSRVQMRIIVQGG